MISSLEEFRLLLKKWWNESTQVAVMSIMRTPEKVLAQVVVQGHIRQLDDNSFTIVADERGNNLATVNFSDCLFGYQPYEDLVGAAAAGRYEDSVVLGLTTEGGHTFVIVMSVKPD